MSMAQALSKGRDPPGRVLLVGVGNVMLGDDGLGSHVAGMLARCRSRLPSHIDVIDAGLCFFDLLSSLPDYRLVVVVDAVRAGGPPGSVYCLELNTGDCEDFAALPLSSHEWNVSAVLAAAKRLSLLPERLVLLGAEPGLMEPSLALSPPLERAARRITAMLLRAFRRPLSSGETGGGSRAKLPACSFVGKAGSVR